MAIHSHCVSDSHSKDFQNEKHNQNQNEETVLWILSRE